MRPRFFSYCLTLLLSVPPTLLSPTDPGSPLAVNGADPVPRDRLMSVPELFALLDRDNPSLAPTIAALRSGDTLSATRVLADHLRNRPSPRYFFPPDSVQARYALLTALSPEHSASILKGARAFIDTYGSDVDWKVPGKDLYGRPHTANTVRLLARQWQAESIALSTFAERDSSYVSFFLALVRDFVSDYEGGRTETGGNDIFERFYAGHRARNWLGAYHFFLGSNLLSPSDQLYLVRVFLLHGARLIDQAKRFNWGNHQLVGLTGVYELTTMFPEFTVCAQWNARARALILEHMEKEIRDDGFQFERASHYFKLDILNYFRVRTLAELNGDDLPPVFHKRFRSMFDAIVALAQPDRSLPVLHDAQDTYGPAAMAAMDRSGLGSAASSHAAELSEPTEEVFMSLGAAIFESPEYKFFGAAEFPLSFFWLLDPAIRDTYRILPVETPVAGSTALRQSGYYVMRSGWDREALYLLIDAGRAVEKPDHSHGQVLGVIASACGQPVLPNYRVRYADPMYPVLKNSLVKNVASADGIPQGRTWVPNKAGTGFGIWATLPTPTVHAWVAGKEFDYFSGSHNAFDTVGVTYDRTVVFFRPSYWAFLDRFAGAGPKHTFEQRWQGEYALSANRAERAADGNARFTVLQADDAILKTRNETHAARPSVAFEKSGVSRYTFMTVIDPRCSPTADPPRVERLHLQGQDAMRISHGRTTDFIVQAEQSEGHYGAYRFTGGSLLLRFDSRGALQSALIVGATRLEAGAVRLESPEPISVEFNRTGAGTTAVTLRDPAQSRFSITAGGDVRTLDATANVTAAELPLPFPPIPSDRP